MRPTGVPHWMDMSPDHYYRGGQRVKAIDEVQIRIVCQEWKHRLRHCVGCNGGDAEFMLLPHKLEVLYIPLP